MATRELNWDARERITYSVQYCLGKGQAGLGFSVDITLRCTVEDGKESSGQQGGGGGGEFHSVHREQSMLRPRV